MNELWIPLLTGATALVGVVVGGAVTWNVERMKLREAAKANADRQRVGDLRAFQTSVRDAIDAIEHDFGEFDRGRREGSAELDWLPMRTYQAIRVADALSVWVVDQSLVDAWDVIRASIHDVQARVSLVAHSGTMTEEERRFARQKYEESFKKFFEHHERLKAFEDQIRRVSLPLLRP